MNKKYQFRECIMGCGWECIHSLSILGSFCVSAHRARLLAMAHILGALLLLITFLQQCRSDISKSSPELWYSANVINDGSYQSQRLAELFPNEETFSTANPIVVAPSTDSKLNGDDAWTSVDKVATNLRKTRINSQVDYTESLSENFDPHQQNGISWPTTPTEETEEDSQSQASFKEWPPMPMQYPSPFEINQTPDSPQQNHPLLFFYQQQSQIDHLPTLPPTPQPSTIPPSSVAITTTGSTFAPIHTSGIISTTAASVLQDTSTNYLLKDMSVPTVDTTTTTKKGVPNFKIRVVAPRGSITNVKINPPSTTRKPTTTKKHKSKKDNRKSDYEICMNSCKSRKHPVCTAPLGVTPIDPDRLKGFPSLCQMACHNSFQKTRYQKLTEGRCGRLRTRMYSLNSRDKLKKYELDKSRYTIVHNAPQTVFELGNVKPLI